MAQDKSDTEMNKKQVVGKSPSTAASSLPKGKSTSNSDSLSIDSLSHAAANIEVDSQDGEWEVCGRKSRNRTDAVKQWASSPSATPKTWGRSEVPQKMGPSSNGGVSQVPSCAQPQTVDSKRQIGRGSAKTSSWEAPYMGPPSIIPPPLQNGWQWAARVNTTAASQTRSAEGNQTRTGTLGNPQEQSVGGGSGSESGYHSSNVSDDEELGDDSDDDLLNDGDYDSDASQKSHETRKKNRWFNKFFESLNALSNEQINELSRQWHCPACQDGPGAIDWYRGMQPLITHAKTKGSKRVKLHRELAELLEEELQRRGTSLVSAGEVFGKWKGLREATTDYEIVWPPMVVIQNTLLEKNEDDKWLGMGNQELIEYFKSYKAVKARHSYGPQGHRGMSVLIFEASAVGYSHADRLDKHLSDEGSGRDNWDRRRVLFYPGGHRRLYGYLASKEDMEIFNQHSQGNKSRVRYEMKSYQEMVVSQMNQMSEDNQQLPRYKYELAKQKMLVKNLEQTASTVGEKLRSKEEETMIMMEKSKAQQEETQKQMDFLEKFYKEQLEAMKKSMAEKFEEFGKERDQNRTRLELKQAKLTDAGSGSKEQKLRLEEVTRILKEQEKGVEEFEMDRQKLIQAHEERKLELKRKHLQEEFRLEEAFDQELICLMDKYTTSATHSSSAS